MPTYTEPEQDPAVYACATTFSEALTYAPAVQNAAVFVEATTNPETFIGPNTYRGAAILLLL